MPGPLPTHTSRTPFLLPAVSKPFRKPQTTEGPLTSCSHPNLTLTPSLQPLGDLSCPCATTLQRIPEGDTAPTKNSLLLDPQEGPPETPKKGPLCPPGPSGKRKNPTSLNPRSLNPPRALKKPPQPLPPQPSEEPRLPPLQGTLRAAPPGPHNGERGAPGSCPCGSRRAATRTGDLEVKRDEGGEVGRSQPGQEQLPGPPRRLPHGGPGGTDTSPRSRRA